MVNCPVAAVKNIAAARQISSIALSNREFCGNFAGNLPDFPAGPTAPRRAPAHACNGNKGAEAPLSASARCVPGKAYLPLAFGPGGRISAGAGAGGAPAGGGGAPPPWIRASSSRLSCSVIWSPALMP